MHCFQFFGEIDEFKKLTLGLVASSVAAAKREMQNWCNWVCAGMDQLKNNAYHEVLMEERMLYSIIL